MEDYSEFLKRRKKKNSKKVPNIQKRLDNDEMRRAGGDVICDVCGKRYYDHPVIEDFEWLHITCDNKIVKL